MTDDVSRETPSAPDAARRVFASSGCRSPSGTSSCWPPTGVVRGLIGPREAPRLWDRHLLNCAVLGRADRRGRDRRATSAPAPGCRAWCWRSRRPDLRVTLVEPLLRRTTFLDEVVDELELGDVEVVRGRAEELHGSATFDVVTARAVAPLEPAAGLVRCPWSRPHGALVAMKGSLGRGGDRRPRGPALARWGCAAPRCVALGAGVLSEPTWRSGWSGRSGADRSATAVAGTDRRDRTRSRAAEDV